MSICCYFNYNPRYKGLYSVGFNESASAYRLSSHNNKISPIKYASGPKVYIFEASLFLDALLINGWMNVSIEYIYMILLTT